MAQKIWSKMHLVSCANTHHDITDFVDLGMVRNTKTWISWERNITFLRNEEILNLCLRWHILRSYCFVAEVTFNDWCFFFSYLFVPPLQKNTQKSSAAILLVNFIRGHVHITVVKTSNVFYLRLLWRISFILSSYKVCK